MVLGLLLASFDGLPAKLDRLPEILELISLLRVPEERGGVCAAVEVVGIVGGGCS